MKIFRKEYLLIILLIAAVSISGFLLGFRQKEEAPRKEQTPRETKKQKSVMTLEETPKDLKPFDFQIKESSTTASVFWDESKIKIFHLILSDPKAYSEGSGEKSLVFSITSLKEPPVDLAKISEAPGYLFQPYLIGTEIEGFVSSKGQVTLEKGKEYWIQLIGISNDNKAKFVSKKFIFGQ